MTEIAEDILEKKILGFRFHPMTKEIVLQLIRENIREKKRLLLGYVNLHGMAMMYHHRSMTDFLSLPETRIMVDGMPIIWIGNLCGGKLSRAYRTTSLDFYDEMFQICSSNNWSIDYVGSTPDVLDRGIDVVKARFPNLDIQGVDGYFDLDDISAGSKQGEILEWLKKRNSDILIVGMGMPRQEAWLLNIRDQIPTRVLMTVGAYMEYQVGSLKLPPRWIGQVGFEWMFRLITSPNRLANRYLIEPFGLLFNLLFKPHPQKKYWKSRYSQ